VEKLATGPTATAEASGAELKRLREGAAAPSFVCVGGGIEFPREQIRDEFLSLLLDMPVEVIAATNSDGRSRPWTSAEILPSTDHFRRGR
jgi:hypothetical protein